MATTQKKRTFIYNDEKVTLSAEKYTANNTLAVVMHYEDMDDEDVITVNIPGGPQSDTLAFVDTNNMPDIARWLTENGIAWETGMIGRSGYCAYPLMEFDLESFNK